MQDFFSSRKHERAKEQQLLEQQRSDLRQGVDRTGFSPGPSVPLPLQPPHRMLPQPPNVPRDTNKNSRSPSSIGASALHEEVFKCSCACPFWQLTRSSSKGMAR